jgi:hypothetical protein
MDTETVSSRPKGQKEWLDYKSGVSRLVHNYKKRRFDMRMGRMTDADWVRYLDWINGWTPKKSLIGSRGRASSGSTGADT